MTRYSPAHHLMPADTRRITAILPRAPAFTCRLCRGSSEQAVTPRHGSALHSGLAFYSASAFTVGQEGRRINASDAIGRRAPKPASHRPSRSLAAAEYRLMAVASRLVSSCVAALVMSASQRKATSASLC